MSTNRYDLASEDLQRFRKSAKLLYISTAKFGGDWHSVPHTHSCAELFYVVGGSGQFRIGDEYYPVAGGDLVVVNSQVVHTETSLNANPMEYIVLGVENLELSRTDKPDEHFCIINLENAASEALGYLKTILKEIDVKAMGYETVCQELLNVFVVLVMRQLNFTATLTPSPGHNSKEGALIHRYIREHFRENLDLDTLAQIAHVSKYHLSHTFTKEYGISPISYLLSLRMQESRDLLRTTNYPLSHIARVAGFSSPSYFSQRFRQAEGMSPAQYRQKFRVKSIEE